MTERKANTFKDLSTIMGHNKDVDILEVLAIDPMTLSEDLVEMGAPLKTPRDEMMVSLQVSKSRLLEKMAEETGDVKFHDTIARTVRILRLEGFEEVLTVPFKRGDFPHIEGIHEDQELIVFAHREKGLIAEFDSYRYADTDMGLAHRNSGKLHYCWRPTDWDSPTSHRPSGTIEGPSPTWREELKAKRDAYFEATGNFLSDADNRPEGAFFKGNHDIRSPIRAIIRALEQDGTLIKTWYPETIPFAMFIHWADFKDSRPSSSSYLEYEKRSWERYQMCPDWFKQQFNFIEKKRK